MLKELVCNKLGEALRELDLEGVQPEVYPSERPEHGDLSSNIAFALKVGSPSTTARRIIAHLDQEPFSQVEVAGAGFINFFFKPEEIHKVLQAVLERGEHFGLSNLGHGKSVQVEYGSANPTGPLHIGFGRNVILGDTIANILQALGYQVEREYYVNDSGTQMEKFSRSLLYHYARALHQQPPLEFPEGGYLGQYVQQWAEDLAATEGDRLLQLPVGEAVEEISRLGLELVLKSARSDLGKLRIHYDRWFYEHDLYKSEEQGASPFAKVMEILQRRDCLEEREGAVWFKASEFGSEKDEVLIRSDGRPGYFASDVAYHYNKLVERGFDWVIDVWGADHQGHVPRMMAMVRALGLDPDRLTLLIYQLVTLKRGEEEVRLSKRRGELITLGELIDEVGPDAVRYFLLSRSLHTHLEFDLRLAQERSKENPVFYIQYAHTRISGIFRQAASPHYDWAQIDLGPLKAQEELELIKQLDEFPEVLHDAAQGFAPHLLANYAYRLAALFQVFYDRHRVLGSKEHELPRLALCRGTQIVLRKVLEITGVRAPERM